MTDTNIKNTQEELDLTEILNIVLKRFWLILGLTLCGIAGAMAVNTFMRPVYGATALLMINQEDAGKIDSNPYRSFMSEEDYYRTQYQLLESRSFLERVYKQLNLSQYEEFANPGGVHKLHKAITVAPITRSRLVNINVRTYDPYLAVEIANGLVNTFVAENLSNRISMGKDVIKALENSENSPEDQEILNSMPQVVNSDFIKSLKQQVSNLESKKAQLSAKYTARHPEIISINNQLATINRQLVVETRRLVQSIKIELSGQFSGNNVRVIDPAVISFAPVRPRKLFNILIGALGGMALGLFFAFLLEFLDQSIKSSQDLEDKLHLSFLGSISFQKVKKREAEYSLMLKEGNSLQAENVRDIRTMLGFALTDTPNAPFLITSPMQGEGKSHLSSNLAVALASAGKKILLVDGDLRRSRLHKVFKLGVDKGLSNIWSRDPEKADYNYNVQPVKDVPNLFMMTSGQRPPNPGELLSTPKLADFIKWAEKNFDQVIIDCPAILPVSDTMLWGKYIPRAVFLVRYGKTNARLARIALDKLNQAGIKILGGVIGQHKSASLTYGYYKSYKYEYKDNDDKKDKKK